MNKPIATPTIASMGSQSKANQDDRGNDDTERAETVGEHLEIGAAHVHALARALPQEQTAPRGSPPSPTHPITSTGAPGTSGSLPIRRIASTST